MGLGLVPFLEHEFNPSKYDGEVMLTIGSDVLICLSVSVNFLARWTITVQIEISLCDGSYFSLRAVRASGRARVIPPGLHLLQRGFCRE